MRRAITHTCLALSLALLTSVGPAVQSRHEAGAQETCGTWTNIGGHEAESDASALAVRSVNELWIGGNRMQGDPERYGPYIKFWNGQEWVFEDTPEFNYWGWLYEMDAPQTGSPWAVGNAGPSESRAVAMRRVEKEPTIALPTADPVFDWERTQTERNHRHANFRDVEVIKNDLAWAVGWDQATDRDGRTVLQRWNGERWRLVGNELVGAFNGIDGTGPNNIWAVGTRRDGALSRPLTWHYNGRRWRSFPAPDFDRRHDGLQAVAVAGRVAWAVGMSIPPDGGVTHPLVMRWNGQRWRRVQTPPLSQGPTGQGVYLWGVSVHRYPQGLEVVVVGNNRDWSSKNGLIWSRFKGEWTWDSPAGPPNGQELLDVEHSPDGHLFAVGNGYYDRGGETLEGGDVVWHRQPRC